MKASPQIPDHTLIRPIGRGAYGEVWLAQNVMGTLRAVKIIERQQFSSDRPYEREFAGVQRYEPVSRSADGLVHVLHVGRQDAEGYFYYVMELADSVSPAVALSASAAGEGVDATVRRFETASSDAEKPSPTRSPSNAGPDISNYSPRTLRSDLEHHGRLPTAECLRLALDIVSALGRLHGHGLVHRDVKPGNIIFVNGRAKLADLGLVSGRDEGRTFVGTEGYIPPEGPGSSAADLYALGVVLYEITTGLPAERFPDVPPEWMNDGVGDEALELHEVILKAGEGDRQRRYQSAEAMQADLALLQSGQSVRRVRALERRATQTRRFGWAAALVLAAAVATALTANWQARLEAENRSKETRLREDAQKSQARAESAERQARVQLNAALLDQARALVLSREQGHRTRSLDALRRVAAGTNAAELRRVAFAALQRPDVGYRGEFAAPPGTHPLTLDPRGERIALSPGRGTILIYRIPDGELLATLGGSTNLPSYQGRWHFSGRYLGVKRETMRGGREGIVELWDVAGATPALLSTDLKIAYASFSFHPREPWIMAGRIGGAVTVWNCETRQEVCQFKLPGTLHALQYSPDGARFAACYNTAPAGAEVRWVVRCHDAATREVLSSLSCVEPVEEIVWDPAGRWISMTGSADSDWQRDVRVMDVQTGAATVLGRHKLKTAVVQFVDGGNYLLSAGWDREASCWDLRTLERAFTGADIGFNIRWNETGTRFAALPEDAVQCYEFESPLHRELRAGTADGIRRGVFSPDKRWLAVEDIRHLCVWDLQQDGPPALHAKTADLEHTFFFSADSTELFAARDRRLDRWRLKAADDPRRPPLLEPLPLRVPPGLRSAVAIAGDILLITTNGAHLLAQTNPAAAPTRLQRMRDGRAVPSPDSRWLAMIYDYSPVVAVFRWPDLTPAARLVSSNLVGHVSFSPEGDELTIINRSGVEWWDTRDWRPTRRQPSRPVAGAYAVYTRDGAGEWLVTHLRNTGLYRRRTLEPLLPLPPNVAPIAVSDDGQTLAVSVDTRRVQLWELAALRAQFRQLGFDWKD